MIIKCLGLLAAGAISCLAGDSLPRIDLHVHTHEETNSAKEMPPADVVAVATKLDVRFGVLAEGGCAGEIHDDRSLESFLKSFDGLPLWRGLQVYGFDWSRCLSKDKLDQLDYIAADALIFPQPDGKSLWLWRPGVQIKDPQEFMERYVEHNVHVVSQRIQIWANATFVPEILQSRYDELWTPERMDRTIAAAVKNGVAIEINARYHIPSAAFIRRAKAAGAKFSFGSNGHIQGIGEIDYCLRVARECGLTSNDIFVPARPLGARI